MTGRAEEAAARLGTTAGERFVDTGVPSKNPLQGKGTPKLAAAWRRAYLAAAKPKEIRRGR